MPGESAGHRQPDPRLAGELAGIHAAAFSGEDRPWSGPEILALPGEAGLLTLSVLSEARRRRLETNAGRLHRRSVALAVGKPWE